MSNNRVVIPSNKYPCDTYGEMRKNDITGFLQVYNRMDLQTIKDAMYYDIRRYYNKSYKYVSYETAFKVSNTVFKKLNSDFFYSNSHDTLKHMDKSLLFVTCPDYTDIITNYSNKFYGSILQYSKTQHALIFPVTIIENIYLSSESKNAKDIFKDELRYFMKHLEDVGATLIYTDYFVEYIKAFLPKGSLNTTIYSSMKAITTYLETDLVKYGVDYKKKIDNEYLKKGATSMPHMVGVALMYQSKKTSFDNDVTKYIETNLIRNGGTLTRDNVYYGVNSTKILYDSMNLVLLDMLKLRDDVTTKLQDVYTSKFNVGYNVTKTFKNIIDDFITTDDLYDDIISDIDAYNITMSQQLPFVNGFDTNKYPNWKAITTEYEKALTTMNNSLSLYYTEAGKTIWDTMVTKAITTAAKLAQEIETLRLYMEDVLSRSTLLWETGTYAGDALDLENTLKELINLVEDIKTDVYDITEGSISTLPKLSPSEAYAANNPTSLDAYTLKQAGLYDKLIAYNNDVVELKPTVDGFKSKIDKINYYYNKVFNETNGLILTDRTLINYSFIWNKINK